jgi:hypothetical protein
LTSSTNLRLTRGLTGSVTADVGCFVLQFMTTHFGSIGTAADYTTGSVTANDGSNLVTGSGTAWLANNRGRGDRITIDGTNYSVISVDSDTQLTLTSAFTGTSGSGKAYTIARKFSNLQAWEDCVSGAGSCAAAAGLRGRALDPPRRDHFRSNGPAWSRSAFKARSRRPFWRSRLSAGIRFRESFFSRAA